MSAQTPLPGAGDPAPSEAPEGSIAIEPTGQRDRLSQILDLKRLNSIAAIAVAVATILAFLFAGQLILARTDLRLVVNSQRFIDPDAVRAHYRELGQSLPPELVVEAVYAYNEQNQADLKGGPNSSTTVLPVKDICSDPTLRAFVASVYTASSADQQPKLGKSCDGGDTIGKGRYYERYLLKLDADTGYPLDAAQIRTALTVLYRSDYRRYRLCVRNIGGSRASDVRIAPSAGYQRAPNFSDPPNAMAPGDEVLVDYDSAAGDSGALPDATHGAAGAPAKQDGLPNGIPASSCLRRPGVTENTAFLVDWNSKGRNSVLPWIGIGVAVVIIAVLMIRGRFDDAD